MYCCYRNQFFSFVQLFYTCCNNIFVFDLQGDSLVALELLVIHLHHACIFLSLQLEEVYNYK